ncbi:pathogenesis-related protein 1-like [Dioscorea cayenensis subsp. rotundata]|uniref:Pathogenesis-related protein 1-like n=1 Tax=Dioscorea cayennensis subsp. rotundata TaxID=55577 RepID=A0AB40BNC3_DIOCR|nr:pathogenesis-related protein 1-like [Dioscorea cayenensis subsp. rotundata]
MSWIVEVESPVAAPRLFKALLEWHNLAPKLTPEIVSSAQMIILNESEGVGSVRQFNFTPVLPFEYIKERLDFVDLEKFESKHSLVEGGDLGTKLEMATTEYKFTPSSTGGCAAKMVMTYKLLPGVEVTEVEEKAKGAVTAIVKAAEAYLIANPNAYA